MNFTSYDVRRQLSFDTRINGIFVDYDRFGVFYISETKDEGFPGHIKKFRTWTQAIIVACVPVLNFTNQKSLLIFSIFPRRWFSMHVAASSEL